MDKFIDKNCSTHGLTTFVLEGRGYYRCKKCRSNQVHLRRKKVKRLLVEYKGGKCEKCGYNKYVEVLDFHHRDPNEKDFGISAHGNTLNLEKAKKEVDKCSLLCANCHREEHIENKLHG